MKATIGQFPDVCERWLVDNLAGNYLERALQFVYGAQKPRSLLYARGSLQITR
jgi:hypothetical protein